MKTILICLFLGAAFYQPCANRQEKMAVTNDSLPAQPNKIDFVTRVQPIFQKNCSPCHFPGGKMYARMPFDKDTTIINHEAGILRRIKNPEEARLIRDFIEENPSSSK